MTAHHAAAAASHTLRVATWNLASCRRGLRGVIDHLRALDAEVVALQEVDRGTTRSDGLDQTEVIAREAGYPHHQFFRATTIRRGDYGLALLSRWPIGGFRVGLLPTLLGLEQRILASAIVELPAAQLSVGVTHLCHATGRWRLRLEQAQRLVARLSPPALPTLLFGDFNDRPNSPVHRALTKAFVDVFTAVGRGPAETFPLPLLRDLRLDYIFASPDVQLERAEVMPTRASDHHALRATVGIPATAAGELLAMAR